MVHDEQPLEENPRVDEALDTLVCHWNKVVQVGGSEWADKIDRLLAAVTVAACKLAFMLIDGGIDARGGQDSEARIERLNQEADFHARRHRGKLAFKAADTGEELARLRKRGGAPSWFVDDEPASWSAGGDDRNLPLVKELAKSTIVSFALLRAGRTDEAACLVAQVIALVAGSKLLFLGLSAEEAGAVERIANRAVCELMATLTAAGGMG